MNKTNMRKLIDQLKKLPDEKFYMNRFIAHPEDPFYNDIRRDKSCGTVACIAGWACLLNGGPTSEIHYGHKKSPEEWAADWLGLNPVVASDLFFGRWTFVSLEKISRDQAIQQLESMLED